MSPPIINTETETDSEISMITNNSDSDHECDISMEEAEQWALTDVDYPSWIEWMLEDDDDDNQSQ